MEENDTISWETTEYVHRVKSADWFWALGIITIAIATASILLGNSLFAILIIIGSFTIALFAVRRPLQVTILLNKKGIAVGTRLYPFSSIKSFWVLIDELPALLLLEVKNPLIQQVTIPIENISPDDVRLFLMKYVEEKEQDHESLIEKISEYFGF